MSPAVRFIDFEGLHQSQLNNYRLAPVGSCL